MFDLITIVQFLWPLLAGAIGAWGFFAFFHKKERRLFKNLQRPIMVFSTKEKNMNHEVNLLKRVGFFNIDSPSFDERTVDIMNGHRLVIIGYTPKSETFKNVFNAAKQREIPVIVYAGPLRITDEDMKILQTYSHHSMCNTPLRLLSDVFAMMSTLPEEKIST